MNDKLLVIKTFKLRNLFILDMKLFWLVLRVMNKNISKTTKINILTHDYFRSQKIIVTLTTVTLILFAEKKLR